MFFGGDLPSTPTPAHVESIPYEVPKLIFLCLWFAIAVISNWVVLAYVHDLVSWNALEDPFFFLPNEEWAKELEDLTADIGNWMVSFSFSSLCLLLIFHRQRFLIFRRVIFMLALLNTLRSLMILFTRIPSSFADNGEKCREQVNARDFWLILQRTWEQAIRIGLQDDKQKMLCGDQFFSGHTLMMTLSALCIDYYVPDGKFHVLKYLPKLFALCGIPCLVISRTHYTCDVMAAYFVTITVFSLYHSLCEMSDSTARKNSIHYQTFLMAKVVHWLERNMPKGRLENEFEIPILGSHKFEWKNKMGDWKGWRRQASQSDSSNNIFFTRVQPSIPNGFDNNNNV